MKGERLYFRVTKLCESSTVSIGDESFLCDINQIKITMKDVEEKLNKKLRKPDIGETPDIVVLAEGSYNSIRFIDQRSFRGLMRRYFNYK